MTTGTDESLNQQIIVRYGAALADHYKTRTVDSFAAAMQAGQVIGRDHNAVRSDSAQLAQLRGYRDELDAAKKVEPAITRRIADAEAAIAAATKERADTIARCDATIAAEGTKLEKANQDLAPLSIARMMVERYRRDIVIAAADAAV